MKKLIYAAVLLMIASLTSCSISNMAMKQPNNHIEFYKGDFEYSSQVSGEATSVKVLMIDWARLFSWKGGNVSGEEVSTPAAANVALGLPIELSPVIGIISAAIPVLGDYTKGQVNNYALYEMMKKNPGYDVVIYPQYETTKFVIPFIYSKTTVKATARLGRIKE